MRAACRRALQTGSVRRRAVILIDWLRRRFRNGAYEVAERALSPGGPCGTPYRPRMLVRLASGSVPSAVGPLPGSQCGVGNGRTIAWPAHDDEVSSRDRSLAAAEQPAEGRRDRCQAHW